MNYYKARQSKATGLYHFTIKNGDNIYPVGYCSLWDLCPDCKGDAGLYTTQEKCEKCNNKGLIWKEKPCPGHTTEAEACEHYHEFVLDEAWFNGNVDPSEKCEICQTLTNRLVTCGESKSEMHVLCDLHANKEHLSKVMKRSTEIWSS